MGRSVHIATCYYSDLYCPTVNPFNARFLSSSVYLFTCTGIFVCLLILEQGYGMAGQDMGFAFAASGPALGPTWPPIQRYPGV
jgi:hypothetical protein